MKKVFIISSLILAVILLFLGIYNVAFKNNPYDPKVADKTVAKEQSSDASPTMEEQSESSQQDATISPVTEEKVIAPSYRKETDSVIYISPADASVKEISLPMLSARTLMQLSGAPIQAVWSPDSSHALVEIRDGNGTRWHAVDVGTNTDVPLKAGMESPAWSNLGDKIIYKYFNASSKERTLNVADPDGGNWKSLGDVPFPKMGMMPIPQSSLIALWNQGDAFEETSLRSIPITGGEMKSLLSGQFGADYRFSPDGSRIIASISDKKGGEFRNLLIPTLVSKVAWSADGQSLYYALPGNIPPGSVLPNDYYSKPILTQDTFWKVDLSSQDKKQRLVDLSSIDKGYDASRLFLDADERYLFFMNRTDGKLYRIRL